MMSVEVISKDSTLDWVKDNLSLKLKNKELFDEIFGKFYQIMSKGKMKFSTSNSSVSATDLTKDYGEEMKIHFYPEKDDYSSIKVFYSFGQRLKRTYDISFTDDKSITVKIEETEFLVNKNKIVGMRLKKITKQYSNNKLVFEHEYTSQTVVDGDKNSYSTDLLMQATGNIGYKRIARIDDSFGETKFDLLYATSDNIDNEVFDTMSIHNYAPATFVNCDKEKYERYSSLHLKKNVC